MPLGEVEAVLEELPGVQQAVALVQEDPTGVQRLVAYVTPATLSAPQLLAGLRGSLPARMMPSTITPLAEVQDCWFHWGVTVCLCHHPAVSSASHSRVTLHPCTRLPQQRSADLEEGL